MLRLFWNVWKVQVFINIKKCEFHIIKVLYLRFIISIYSFKMDLAKIKIILEGPQCNIVVTWSYYVISSIIFQQYPTKPIFTYYLISTNFPIYQTTFIYYKTSHW